MDTITEHQANAPQSYKRLNIENAVKSTLASVRGIQQVNRLIPMFSMRATQSQQFIRDTKGAGESASWEKDEPFETSAIDSWLFTTSTQVATAGLTGDLAYTGFQDTDDNFGTDQRTIFKAGLMSGTGGALPSYRFTQWGVASTPEQLPSASFYLFATETKPVNMPSTTQLIPLWRLSTRCFEIRKYSYSTNAAERNTFTASGTSGGDTVATCIPDTSRRYWEEGIEGYVLSEQLPGTVPLFRVAQFSGASSTVALTTKSPDDNAAFSGLSDFAGPAGNALLGYVYPTEVAAGSNPRTLVDTDGDGLEDQFEGVTGLNEQAADSDCDGNADGVEFPIAGVSPSDPMSTGGNCHDLRVRSQANAPGLLRLSLENFGPSVGAPARFKISLFSASTFTANVSVPTGCVSTTPPPHIGQMDTWSCAISGFAAGASSLVSVNQIVPSSAAQITLKGEVELGVGQFDPVLGNNLAQVSCSGCSTQ